jgi:hypothetical protein
MECIRRIISLKEDVLAILTTRFGKNVIYQLIPKVSKTSAVDAVVGSPLEYICCNVYSHTLITSDKKKDSDVPPIFSMNSLFLNGLNRDNSTCYSPCLESKHVHCALSPSHLPTAAWISGKIWLAHIYSMTQDNITVDRSVTKGWQTTRVVNVSGILFSPSPIRPKKRTPDCRFTFNFKSNELKH